MALLARDLAALPPKYVERAANEWAQTSPFMPKPVELIALCRGYEREDAWRRSECGREASDEAAAFVQERATHLASAPDARRDIEWHVDGDGTPRLRFKDRRPSSAQPAAIDAAELVAHVAVGLSARGKGR